MGKGLFDWSNGVGIGS